MSNYFLYSVRSRAKDFAQTLVLAYTYIGVLSKLFLDPFRKHFSECSLSADEL